MWPLPGNGDEPAVSYIFPAGGQQGTRVNFRVGGMYLHEGAALEMFGKGVTASPRIVPTETIWFEGPLVPLPGSQQKEDYPKDYSGQVEIAADAPIGVRHWRVSTSQGATPSMKFVVGRLPEVIEDEVDGEPVPVAVTLPVTINGRIFPREDIDDWCFTARRGELIYAEVVSARLGLPLEARLVLYDGGDKPLAEDVGSQGGDARLRITIPEDGTYRLRIHDVNFSGLQNYVYRLTITSGPRVDRLYPLGGRRGSTVRMERDGFGVPPEPVEVAIPSDAPSWFVPPVSLATGPAELGLEIDDVPELLESEPNNSREHAASLSAPGVLNGRIGGAGDVDFWAFSAKGGEPLDLAVSAARLGSPLDPLIVIEDAAGKQLAGADDSPGSQSDARLRFTATSDGTYYVRIADRFASRGGSAFAYRLRIAPVGRPDFHLTLASDALTLYRGGETRLRVMCERSGGFAVPVKLTVDGLPVGITLQGAEIPANQPHVDLAFKANVAARIEASHLQVRGTAEVDGQPLARIAALAARPGETAVADVLLAVSMPTPFKVVGKYDLTFAPRGSLLVRHYTINRGGFTGKLTVQLADRQARHLQGVTGPAIVVPAESSDCDYPVFLPPWMELGRTSRSVVMAVGVVTDAEGREHTVSFSSQNQNEQIVALVSPGELNVQAAGPSLACSPDSEVIVRVGLARDKSLKGPAKVELIVPKHMRGISADSVTVPPEADAAELHLRCAGTFGPLNMPVTIRATSEREGRQVVAETKLQLVSGSGKP